MTNRIPRNVRKQIKHCDVLYMLVLKDGKSTIVLSGDGEDIDNAVLVGQAMLGQLEEFGKRYKAKLPASPNAVPLIMVAQNAYDAAPELKALENGEQKPDRPTEGTLRVAK